MDSTLLDLLSTGAGLAGALLLAIKSRMAPWAWAVCVLSSGGLMISGLSQSHFGALAQNTGFFITSCLGCWVWLVQPYIGKRKADEPEALARNLNLEQREAC